VSTSIVARCRARHANRDRPSDHGAFDLWRPSTRTMISSELENGSPPEDELAPGLLLRRAEIAGSALKRQASPNASGPVAVRPRRPHNVSRP